MIYSSPFPDCRIPEVPLVDFVLANAASRNHKAALIDGISGRSVSYGQLVEETRAAARGLAGDRYAKDDRWCHSGCRVRGRNECPWPRLPGADGAVECRRAAHDGARHTIQ